MKIACMQVAPVRQDIEMALGRLKSLARQARDRECSLLVTPEMYLTGYNIGADSVARLAGPADGEMATAVARIAQTMGVAILFGFPERDVESGKVFNAVQLVDEGGAQLFNYRKTHLLVRAIAFGSPLCQPIENAA